MRRSHGFDNPPGWYHDGRAARETFSVTCAGYGKDARVPFQPVGERPISCSDCIHRRSRSTVGRTAARRVAARSHRPEAHRD